MPSIVSEIDDDATPVRDEQFGPALPVLALNDVDEAIRRANASLFDVGANMWTPDPDRARSVANQIEVGMRFLNRHDLGAVHSRGMFGGVKQSAIGCEFGTCGLEGYTELRQAR